MNRHVASAVRSINTSLPDEIGADDFARILAGGASSARWTPHVRIFLEESPPELLHNLVLSGATDFGTLKRLAKGLSIAGRTGAWIDEMAR